MDFKGLYETFLIFYGPQGWWPVTRSGRPEYFPGNYEHPRNEREAWEIMVGAVLTQNTAWKNVEKAILALLAEDCLDIECIARVSQKKLASLIKPSGYYNQKAERLQILARHILKNWKTLEKFFSRPLEEIREELLSLKGIGPETADSILLYAGKKPVFVVDAYTRRIFTRLGLAKGNESYEELREVVEREFSKLPEDTRRKVFNEFHALLVRHGKEHCKKKPVCRGCPLARDCGYQTYLKRQT